MGECVTNEFLGAVFVFKYLHLVLFMLHMLLFSSLLFSSLLFSSLLFSSNNRGSLSNGAYSRSTAKFQHLKVQYLLYLKMDAARTSETFVFPTTIHGATTQKASSLLYEVYFRS